MLEAMLIGICATGFALAVYNICDAGAGGWGGYHHAEKWAVNPRAMRWLIPLVGTGVCAYLIYLKVLGLI